MKLSVWIIVASASCLKFTEGKSEFTCTDPPEDYFNEFQRFNIGRLNQLRKLHKLPPVKWANEGKIVKWKIFSSAVAKNAQEAVERSCESKEVKLDEKEMLCSTDHSVKGPPTEKLA